MGSFGNRDNSFGPSKQRINFWFDNHISKPSDAKMKNEEARARVAEFVKVTTRWLMKIVQW